MKSHHLFCLSITCAASAAFSRPILPSYLTSQVDALHNLLQRPLLPYLPGAPGEVSSPDNSMPADSDSDLIISDVLPRSRSIQIFAGFTRDVDPVSSRFDDQSKNSTILAPLNSAIQNMDRKPWEDPREYAAFGTEAAYGMGDGEERAHKNLGRFVQAHVVPASPWEKGEKVETLAGTKVWWEVKDGKKVIQPGEVTVSSIASKVANGEVWILEGVLNDS